MSNCCSIVVRLNNEQQTYIKRTSIALQSHKNRHYALVEVAESFAKEHGLWLPIENIYRLYVVPKKGSKSDDEDGGSE